MENKEYGDDSLAIILLCSNLLLNAKIDKDRPFTTIQWTKLAKKILSSKIKRPSRLFNLSQKEIERELVISKEESERIVSLLGKAGQLSFILDSLKNKGIKILTRADEVYPIIFKRKLKEKCPPVIYYCGDLSLLKSKFIGVVGSRDVDIDGLEFTRKIAGKIVSEGYALVSGGAKGVDSIAQEEVLKQNGKVVAFVSDSMISKIMKKDIREAIQAKKLLIMSIANPNARFQVYSAMDRNKYIYGLSDMTVVSSSDYNKGGTWTGAVENLKNNWGPLLVRGYGELPKGNKELIEKGGVGIDKKSFLKPFKEYIAEKVENEVNYEQESLLSLLTEEKNSQEKVRGGEEKQLETNIITDKEEYTVKNQIDSQSEKLDDIVDVIGDKTEDYDIYVYVKKILNKILNDEGLSLEEIAKKINVNKKQASDWLNRGIEEGEIQKKTRPVRYIKMKIEV